MTINDISAFVAFGKRFSVDIKLHGIGCLTDSVSFEAEVLDYSTKLELVEILVPKVIALSQKSYSIQNRQAGERLKMSIDRAEYPLEEVFLFLGAFCMEVSSS